MKPLRCQLRSTATRALLLAALLMTLAGCKIELNANLDEQEANEMLAALLSNGIVAEKVAGKDGITLRVERSQFSDAVEALNALGLPRKRFSNTSEIFASEGLVASPVQEWARFNYAKSQELSHSLSLLPGVVRVDVHVALARRENPFSEPSPPSASILMVMHEDLVTDDLIPKIKQLVAYSIPDIDYERVGVMITPVPTPQARQTLVSFGGMIVHQRSARALQILAVVAAVATAAAVGLGTYFLLNRSAAARLRRSK